MKIQDDMFWTLYKVFGKLQMFFFHISRCVVSLHHSLWKLQQRYWWVLGRQFRCSATLFIFTKTYIKDILILAAIQYIAPYTFSLSSFCLMKVLCNNVIYQLYHITSATYYQRLFLRYWIICRVIQVKM